MSNTPGGDTTLKRLQVVLTGNTRQLQQAMSQAQQVTSQTESRIKGSMDKVGATLKRVGAIAAASSASAPLQPLPCRSRLLSVSASPVSTSAAI